MTARRGIFVAPFDELSEPALVAELATRAETRGWGGFFVWDHVAYRAPVRAVAAPWVTRAGIAVAHPGGQRRRDPARPDRPVGHAGRAAPAAPARARDGHARPPERRAARPR